MTESSERPVFEIDRWPSAYREQDSVIMIVVAHPVTRPADILVAAHNGYKPKATVVCDVRIWPYAREKMLRDARQAIARLLEHVGVEDYLVR